MKRVLHLSAVQRAVRAKVCGGCAKRSRDGDAGGEVGTERPRACEAGCGLFQDLPRLWDLAVRIDPMVGRFEPAMSRAVREAQGVAPGSAAAGAAPLCGSGRAMIDALRELSGK
jgi:hypothetical protein